LVIRLELFVTLVEHRHSVHLVTVH